MCLAIASRREEYPEVSVPSLLRRADVVGPLSGACPVECVPAAAQGRRGRRGWMNPITACDDCGERGRGAREAIVDGSSIVMSLRATGCIADTHQPCAERGTDASSARPPPRSCPSHEMRRSNTMISEQGYPPQQAKTIRRWRHRPFQLQRLPSHQNAHARRRPGASVSSAALRYMHLSPNAFSRTARFRPSAVGLLHRYAVRLAFVFRTGA